jgi:hypothetical protein
MSETRSMRKDRTILGLVGFFLVAYFGWLFLGTGDFFTTHRMNAANRIELMKIREQIHPGDSYESVLKVFWQKQCTDLRLLPETQDAWSITMPYEVFATNWVLRLEFKDGRVSSIRVRNSDGVHPHHAPADISG